MNGSMLGSSMRRRRGARAAERDSPSERARFPWERWLLLALLLLPLAFGAGYGVAVQVLFPPPTDPGDGVRVPELGSMTLDRAGSELEARGLSLGDILEMPHPDRPAGTVFAQAPLAGQRLPAGGEVELSVSTGPPQVYVPDVAGMPADRATELLARMGFDVDRREEPAPAEPGQVVRMDPRAGTEVVLPSRVTIVVSTGLPVLLDPDVDDPVIDLDLQLPPLEPRNP